MQREEVRYLTGSIKSLNVSGWRENSAMILISIKPDDKTPSLTSSRPIRCLKLFLRWLRCSRLLTALASWSRSAFR